MYNTWLLVTFSMMRAFYSAAVEAVVTWCLNQVIVSLFPAVPRIDYIAHYLFWFIVGSVVACFQYRDVLKY